MKSILKNFFVISIVAVMTLMATNVFANADDGQVLTGNNAGWKRYECNNSKIVYSNFLNYTGYKYMKNGSGKVSFKFTGTKLRINGICDGNYVTNYRVIIDGVSTENLAKRGVTLSPVAYETTNLSPGIHDLVIEATNPTIEWSVQVYSIDVGTEGKILSSDEIGDLAAIPGDSQVTLTWDPISSANEYIVKYGEVPGKYTESKIVSANSYSNCIIDGLENGTAYYFIVCPKISGIEKGYSNQATATPISSQLSIVLDIEPEKDKIKLGEIVSTDITIDNIKDIAAEDIIIKYDAEKLEFISQEEVNGIKVIYDNKALGELRFILASKGESNIIDSKKTLLNLKFKGIQKGEAIIDIIKGKVSDGIEMEKDLAAEQCDEAKIIVEGVSDVNKNGEFTLLDLAIDARHLNKDPNLAELQKYNTDIVLNGVIDELDLLEIGRLMLLNENYSFNQI